MSSGDEQAVHPANVENLSILMTARWYNPEQVTPAKAQSTWEDLNEETKETWRDIASVAIRIVTGQIDAYIGENSQQLQVMTEGGLASRLCFVLEQEDAS